MKLFLRYLRQQRRVLLISTLFLLIFIVSFILYRLPIIAVIYPMLLCFTLSIIFLLYDFEKVKEKHESLEKIQSLIDAASNSFPKANGIENEDYQKIIFLLSDEYTAYKSQTDKKYKSMIDYYTVWAHQIKTPIASMRLHLQNEDNALARGLLQDLFHIEQYVEMVLTFLRLDSNSTDYVFREYDLDKIVKASVKKFSREFIDRRLSLEYKPLNCFVTTDEKWLGFVIEQVLSNALKYTPSGSITITLESPKTLRITDTGIGIEQQDLPRIFENGYTGYNGRTDRRASGIGLYLCKRICNNLGHNITVTSIVDKGTTVDIDLSQKELEFE